MIYTQVHLSRDMDKKLGVSIKEDPYIDRVYRKYVPTANVLSIPVKASVLSEEHLVVPLEQGIGEMIAATKAEAISDMEKLSNYIKELDDLLKDNCYC